MGAFPTVDVIQEKTKDLMNEVTGNINQMTIDYCLKFNIDPDVLIKQKAEIELLQMKIADIKANCDLAIEGRDIKIKELERLNSNQAESLRITMLEEEKKYKQIEELEQQIEKMKCWCNCKNYLSCLKECCRKNISFEKGICYNCKKWEIKEK